MKSRLAVIVVAVLLPVAVVTLIVVRRGNDDAPRKLPIGTSASTRDALARPELYPYGGIVYKAGPGLPALDGSAHAYKVTPDPGVTSRLRAAFPADGFEADASSFAWSYVNPSTAASSSSGVAVACAPDAADCPVPATTVPPPPADLPTHDEAKAIALDVLQRAGVDTSSVAVTIDNFTTQWSVRVDPIIGGTVTYGFGTNVTIGDHGVIEYASGLLGRTEPADEYPLLGTAAAIELLNQGRGFIGPVPLAEGVAPQLGAAGDDAATSSSGSAAPGAPALPPCNGSGAPTTSACVSPPDTPDTTPTTGTLVTPPPQEVLLTDAERVLMFAPSYVDGGAFLVPGYRFHTGDGEGPTVLAIDERYIVTQAEQPSSRGVDPGASTEPSPPQSVEPAPAPASPATETTTTGG